MIRFCARRLILGIITLWLVSLLVFIATQALSGDAATVLMSLELARFTERAAERDLPVGELSPDACARAIAARAAWLGA